MKIVSILVAEDAVTPAKGAAVTVTDGTTDLPGTVFGITDLMDPTYPDPVLVQHTHDLDYDEATKVMTIGPAVE